VANCPPSKDCTAAMGYCMASDHDTRVSMSPQPPQDGRWATFVPASYKNMALGDPQLMGGCPCWGCGSGVSKLKSVVFGLRHYQHGIWDTRDMGIILGLWGYGIMGYGIWDELGSLAAWSIVTVTSYHELLSAFPWGLGGRRLPSPHWGPVAPRRASLSAWGLACLGLVCPGAGVPGMPGMPGGWGLWFVVWPTRSHAMLRLMQ
jgi:hypothetical protein